MKTAAFAIIPDPRRPLRVRLARVQVLEVFEVLQCAEVTEQTPTSRLTHWLPFAQLTTKPAELRAKVRAFLSANPRPAVVAENPASLMPGATPAAPADAIAAARWDLLD